MKKEYKSPEVYEMTMTISSLLYEVSVPGGNPDEGDPEAKPMDFVFDEEEEVIEEDEKTKVFSFPKKFTSVWE